MTGRKIASGTKWWTREKRSSKSFSNIRGDARSSSDRFDSMWENLSRGLADVGKRVLARAEYVEYLTKPRDLQDARHAGAVADHGKRAVIAHHPPVSDDERVQHRRVDEADPAEVGDDAAHP